MVVLAAAVVAVVFVDSGVAVVVLVGGRAAVVLVGVAAVRRGMSMASGVDKMLVDPCSTCTTASALLESPQSAKSANAACSMS